MNILDGVSQCWLLSKSCVVNWSAWSAIATAFAGGVALYVGITPERIRRESAKRRAHAFLQWAERSLTIQNHHLAVAIGQMGTGVLQGEQLAAVLHELDALDPTSVRLLTDCFDAVDPSLVGEVARCVTDMDTAIRLRSNLRHLQDHAVDVAHFRLQFQQVLGSMEDARLKLAKAVYGANGAEPTPPQVETARQISALDE
ncbi:hypothetical protein H7691_12630 [Stenotrophomonas sp. CW117]|uniref:hypothetical protein n=1 Tax=Stenotrophomonas TaxID=40323 RepID=UPI00128F4F27|nr:MULTISPECIES: hypothetical protein [Stenotrophomonas]QOF97480.1 hypothetical protein H7691_12630 [Stenotrophomonas sp. CW117]